MTTDEPSVRSSTRDRDTPRPTASPSSIDELATAYRDFHAEERPTLVVGSGTHQDIGFPVRAPEVVSTAGLDQLIAHEPEDLTLTVGAGVTLAQIDELLAPHGQTTALPETEPGATIGGVVSAARSGYRRHRFGPTRDRLLEVTVVTGDGRVVTGGARVVKNVSGYDLPRIVTGAFGAMGVVASVCLKLWPTQERRVTVDLDDADQARAIHRPLAVLETRDGVRLYAQGPDCGPASMLGNVVDEAHVWPELDGSADLVELRVRPSDVPAALERLPDGTRFVAQHGVGLIEADLGPQPDPDLRRWCESVGGSMVVVRRSGDSDAPGALDPWGTPPGALSLQRRLIAAFDPARLINRGRLPGRI